MGDRVEFVTGEKSRVGGARKGAMCDKREKNQNYQGDWASFICSIGLGEES